MGDVLLLRRRLARLHALDVAVFRRATRNEAPRLDAALYPLSRLADNSKLWMLVSAGLAAAGGRRGRRSSLRGMVSVGITSAVANGLLKPLVRRRRPLATRSDWLTRVAAVPASSSFPSGHSASAAAFAVGATMELPVVGPPLGLLASAVGFSRVRTRVHYPGDVVAGFALGAGIALLTRKLWPVAPDEPAAVSRSFTHRSRGAMADGAGLSIVVNPSAGSDDEIGVADALRTAFPAAEVVEPDDSDGMGAALDHAARATVIGIVGGDGSINAAAERAMRAAIPLAIVPGGTLNHFARDLGITDADDAIAAVRAGELARVDVGMIADKPFLNTASFGSYAELVDAREQLEDRIGKWPAMAVALVRVLRTARPIEVILDGVDTKVWMIFIGNCEYQPAGMAPGWRERLDDGLLDVRYVDGGASFSRLRLVLAVLTGQLGRSKVYRRLLVPELEIRSLEGPLRLARDGETFDGGTTVTVTKHDIGLTVYVTP